MATTSTEQLDTIHHFATPEHISFDFRLAGPMVRAMAWLIDMLVLVVVGFCLLMVISFILPNGVGSGLILVLIFFFYWLYNILLEWLWQGFTPGKKALGIRVIGSDGLPLTFRASFLRNTLRYADWLPTCYVIGMIALFFSGRFQRLGDLAAGTLVVYVDEHLSSKPLIIKNKQVEKLLEVLPPEATSHIDAPAAKALANYASARLHYHPDRRNEIAAHLAQPLAEKIGLRNYKPDILLSALYMRLFHGDDEAIMASKAAQYLGQRRKHWKNLEKQLLQTAKAQNYDAEEMARRYRSACADLALADAYQLPPQNVNYLHGLVSRSHLRFYQHVDIKWRDIAHLLFHVVPGRLYHDTCLRIACLAFFGVFFACGIIGAFNPDLPGAYVGEATIAQMEHMYVDPPNDRDSETAAAMSGFYIFNNVGISFSCFASGIFAGIGSLIWLVYNGVYLGLIFGYMGSARVDADIQAHFFEFVTAHGPFELVGIMLSGAAGLRLGLGMIITKGLPRLESLQLSAKQAVPLMCVAAISVAMAAPIEAFISPSHLSMNAKISVHILSLLFIIGYFLLGRRYSEANMLATQDGLA